MKTSCKFATSPDILVAKEENSVADAIVLVTISSPVDSKVLLRDVSRFSNLGVLWTPF